MALSMIPFVVYLFVTSPSLGVYRYSAQLSDGETWSDLPCTYICAKLEHERPVSQFDGSMSIGSCGLPLFPNVGLGNVIHGHSSLDRRSDLLVFDFVPTHLCQAIIIFALKSFPKVLLFHRCSIDDK